MSGTEVSVEDGFLVLNKDRIILYADDNVCS